MMKFIGNTKFETIGSDPEFFITKNERALPSSIFITPDYKGSDSNYPIFKDNLLIEGNIPYSTVANLFVFNMTKLVFLMNTIVNKRQAVISSKDAMKFAPRFLMFPDASNFGCSGYYNAWDDTDNDFLISKLHSTPILKGPIRTAGFHIHLGVTYTGEYQSSTSKKTKNLNKELKNTPMEVVLKFHMNRIITRLFDLLVTNPSRYVHVSRERALGYGGFGAFRTTPYGLECRSLGGYFTQHKYLSWVADQSIKVIKYAGTLIEQNPDALIYFSRNVKLETVNDIYLDPKLYKIFNLNYDKEISKINDITKYEKVRINTY